jgi:hypothetical protein
VLDIGGGWLVKGIVTLEMVWRKKLAPWIW